MENNKRIFLLKGRDDEPFEQAIFILKGNKSLVGEAERIIESCMSNRNFYTKANYVPVKFSSEKYVTEKNVQLKHKASKKRKSTASSKLLDVGIVISLLLLTVTVCTLIF